MDGLAGRTSSTSASVTVMDGGFPREQAEYWRTMLANAPEPLELPADRPRRAQPEHAGAVVRLELDEEVTAGLMALGSRHGATLSATLLAGWAAVLGRLSGQTDLVIGCFELPVRVDLSGSPTAAELVRGVQARVQGALRHQGVPFQRVVERARPDGAASGTPLFRAALAWREAPVSGPEPRSTAGLDLSLELQEEEGRVAGEVVFATARFDRETVERYAGYLCRVLAGMAADETRPVDRLALLSDEERRLVTEEWNRTERQYPRDVCVHELFEAQVRERPDAVALVWGEAKLTYRELSARANQLAHHLIGLGVGPEARVGVMLERGVDLMVSLLAVLKAGGCYVPLDPGYPAERLRLMLDDSGVRVLLTRGDVSGVVETGGLDVVHLDRAADVIAAEPVDAPRNRTTAENLAFIVYTSGSTGRPKGVMVGHRHVVQLVVETDYLQVRPGDRLTQGSNAGFDALTFEVWGAFLNGATLVGIPQDVLLSPPALRQVLREERITTFFLTTALLNQLAHEDPGIFTLVREVLFGGQAVDADSVRRLLKAGGPQRLLHMYGPAEATTFSLYEQVEHVAEDALTVPLGHATGNQRIYLLDGVLNPVPRGVTGEAYVGGAGVARGYLGRPGLTAERFIPDPFATEPGARMYRTGDRMRWGRERKLEFVGRVDEQVKIRGFRVEPGEIEARLLEHPGVRAPVVLLREDAPGDQRLVAYYLADQPVAVDALKSHLANRLPGYMVPAAYVWMEAYPLTPNGKTDRKALPVPVGDAYAAREYEAPVGETEQAVAAIWTEVLGAGRVGRRDNLFERGGHSLVAVRVVSRVREALGVEVAPRDLFERPVLADFARGLQAAARAEQTAIAPVERSGPLALSFAQQRLWFLEQLGGTGAAYHISLRLRLRGALDRGALVRTLDRIVARHEALRTTFPAVDGEPVQHIASIEQSAFRLVEHDLRASADADDELRRVVRDEASAPFDLARGPLFRGRLVRMAADDHVLLLTMHHIVSDGWSMGVLHRELGALYAAFARGEPDPLPPLPVQYADYAAWHRRLVEGEVLRRQAEYWRETLAGAPELLELPADHPRPARQDFAGASLKVELDEALTAALRTLSQRHGATLYMTLLAGWAAVLARLSGQDEVVIGTPSANRGRSEIEGLIGFFVNTLPLRVDLSGVPTVAGLLDRVRVLALEAQQNQDIPFEQVVERVRPARSLAYSPLFQVMFAWQNAPRGSLELPRLRLSPADAEPAATAKFDLLLSLWEEDGRIAGDVEYATSLLERATVQRYVGYLRRVLEEMAADDSAPIHRLALLDAAERRVVVEEWNATDAGYPAGACVHDLFRAQAARTPEAVALSWRGERLTYAQLEARANQIANALRRRGVGPEVRVGICLPRTPELVAAMLGVLGAGGAYVPLDPAYPRERLGYMLEDAGVTLVLTESSLADRLPEGAAGLLLLDRERDSIAAESTAAPESGAVPENLSHVIFTSGSTGRPKGVMIRHSSTVVLLHWLRENVTDEERSSVLFSTSINFDVSIAEVFGTLAWGGKLVIAENALELATLGEEVVYASMVPSVAAELLRSGGIPASVKTLNLGGEPLPNMLAQGLYALETVEKVGNLYGPTEDTTYSTYSLVPRSADQVLVGTPVANTRAYVLDAHLQPVPMGVVGELYLAGDGLSRGYANGPAMTAERFVPCPFGAPGARMYRVMDRIRRRADGELEYLGRTDFQVKVRGFRIELGEIEARLASHPGVREAVALALNDAAGGKRLVAYFVGEALESEALRAHLSARLPEYMVPAAFVRLDAFPLTPNGKLDRRALPAPDADAFAARTYEAPVGEAEQALAEIWSELLGTERVGRRDNFFALGGHSLLAVRVVSRVRQALGAEVSPGDLFERPALADFAYGLQRATGEGTAIVPVERSGALPLSFAQQRLWFIDQLEGASAAYHLPMRLRLKGALDRQALLRALERIVARHEALRTRFPQTDGVPAQRISAVEESPFHLVEHDLTASADAEDELHRLMRDEVRARFDLVRGPPVRGRLIRLAGDDHVLLITMHHIVSDGWSLGIFTRELSALYAAFARGEADPLPPLAVQYADYTAWQRRRVDGEVLQRQADYWREALSGVPELLELPTDRPRPARQDFMGASLQVELDEALVAGVTALSRRHGTTPFMTVLAAWAVVLSRLSGQDDVVVGTPAAGRVRGEAEGLIGFFVNTLALRVELSGAPTVAELLGRVRERALDAQRHQDVPFEQVVERVQPARSLTHTPLFQAMLAWQEMPGGALELPGLDVVRLDAVEEEAAQFDLTLGLTPSGGRISGEVVYATALFDRATVERYVGYLRRVLEEMAADDSRPVSRLDLLSPAERRQVIEGWNATDAGYPAGACVHDLFRAQAARTPESVALSWQGERLTYAQLEARANQIANALRRRGVGPEVRVGICLPRTPELVATMLGVLKAGGAYVPLDPAYPRERLGYMLGDAGVTLVLTESSLADRLPESAAALLLDVERDAIAAESADAPESGVVPENLSHVIFTSGSTGRPKGVMIRHSSVVVLLHWLRENISDEERSSVLFSTSINFDVSVAEVFGTLAWGGKLVIAENALELATLDEEVVHVSMVPSAAAELLRSGGIPASVKTLNLGGEPLPNALAQGLYALETVEKVGNLYGPTEDTTYSTYYVVPRGAEQVLVGTPVANTRAYAVDAHLQPVPIGAVGELYLAGDGLSRGYANHPAMTAERFVPCPFGEPGGRMYRVMDRIRRRPDGELEYLGRTDFQVKVRGYRIELGEIEARLAEHAGVRAPVVLVREDTPGDRRLVAYYLADEPVAVETLKAHLTERLPGYMVPAAFVWMEAYPLTPNGKVDRKALPAPEGDAYAAREYEAPAGEAEEAVAAIWAELLSAERVGRRDHFFEMGGHSLLAVRVVSRVRQVLGVEASLRDLFERPVLRDFAREMETAARAELPPIEPAPREGRLPLSFAQQRLWFLEQMGNLGSAYHIPMRLRLRGELDHGALVRALDRIVARHEVLRTFFPTVDGEPVQHVATVEESGFRLVEHDLRASPNAEDELRRVLSEGASAPFDLARGPLFRGRLIRLAADDHVLLLTMHHIVSDGWSTGVLFRDLAALYAAFARGEPDPLPPLPVQYVDYAAWHRRWVDGPVLEAQAEYWTRSLAGAPELLELPTDHPRPAKQDFTGALVNVELDEALTAGLRTLSQRHGTTLFMTLLAGWAAVLARLSGQDDVVIGTPTANRGRAEVEELVGFFVNTLPLRVDLSGAPTVSGLLDRVRALALEAQRNQDIPFEQVVERVHPTRSLAHTPLFQVMFAWENAPEGGLELPGVALDPLDLWDSGDASTQVSAKFDLSLALREDGGRIAGVVEYATALFDQATVERQVDSLRRVLQEMVADEAKPVHRLNLLSAAERRVVVEEWNATDAAFPADACIHELFQAQVERTPGAVAVSFEGGRLTYAELNARANRLAHHLRALGVGPEVRVAVCVKRGLETVVSLLAVLKAGGGYVPLDPGNPDDRLLYAVADSAPAALLTGGQVAARFAGAGVPLVDPEDPAVWEGYPASDPDRAEVGVGPENLAYVIYTSGSTGRPKGVVVRHGSLVNLQTVTRAAFGVGPDDMMPALAPSAFDISLFEILLPLVSGAELRMLAARRVMDARSLLDEITDATLLHAVPVLMRDIVDVERRAPRLTRLRATFVGGEQVPADLLADMRAVFPAARGHVFYGPTEATILASAHGVPEDGAVSGHPIGRPLGNVRLYVCDPLGQPQPVGVAGELLIGGMGVARGYLGRPALTAERFVPDPFSAVPGARLYRSGDRARWTERGVLEFLGRIDFQVKMRGFRIELGEIEARLREHPAVRQAVVLAREDAPGRQRLVVYVVGEASADALKAHLEARVPGYMVPEAYVRLEALPLTGNGKLDRRALPVPDGTAYARRGLDPPRNMTEHLLAEIWAELLGVQRVGRRDHFFDLGGHSLLAVRMVARVREVLNPSATVDQVFAHPTLYEFAAQLQGAGEWLGTTHAIPVRATGSERPLFVPHDALGLVFYGQVLRPHLDPEIPIYALPGPLNDPEEPASMDDLVTRLLRMVKEVQPEGPYRLAGWSAGGIFAYALAERLLGAGAEVEFLGLLDTTHPSRLQTEDTLLDRKFMVLDLLARDSGEMRATPEALKALRDDTEDLDLPAFITRCKVRGLLPESVTVARAEQVDSRITLIKRSLGEYVPGPLPVSAHIFATDDPGDPHRGWEDMPGGAPFRVERVPGTHHTMWKKGNVEVVGATISRAVRGSAAGAGSDR
jgi:amino acid adenylation domain-containing protein